jgi:peroxiredoxin Q/BCP
MAQLRQDYDKFIEQDTEVIVLGPESAFSFSLYWKSHKLPFIGLPDPTHSVLKLYGQKVNLFKFGRMPAQVSVDMQGRVRFVHYGHDMSDIPSNEEMLDVLKIMNSELITRI